MDPGAHAIQRHPLRFPASSGCCGGRGRLRVEQQHPQLEHCVRLLDLWPSSESELPQVLWSVLMIIICCFTDIATPTVMAYEALEAGVLLHKPRNLKTETLGGWYLDLQTCGFIDVLEMLSSFAVSYWNLRRSCIPFSTLVPGRCNTVQYRSGRFRRVHRGGLVHLPCQSRRQVRAFRSSAVKNARLTLTGNNSAHGVSHAPSPHLPASGSFQQETQKLYLVSAPSG